jgi:hypothetical protein
MSDRNIRKVLIKFRKQYQLRSTIIKYFLKRKILNAEHSIHALKNLPNLPKVVRQAKQTKSVM